MMRSMFRVLGVVLLLGHTAFAHAQCMDVTSGSVATEQCDTGELRYWIVRADLAAGDVGVRVARSMERGEAADAWTATIPGASAVVQAGAFVFPSFEPEGLTVGEGEAWPDSADDGALSVLAFDERNVGIVVDADQVVPFESWMRNVLSGARVLRAGVPESCVDSCARTSRTGVGLSEDGRVLVIVVAEGDREGSAGVNLEELGALMRDAGAHDAVASGEGATSALWSAGSVASPSSDGALRPAASYLAVVDRASGTSTTIQGVVGIEGRPEEFLPESMLVVERTDGRIVAMGAPVTTGAYWEFSVPIGEYIVRAQHPGYRRGCKLCGAPIGEEIWCSVFLSPGDGEETCVAPPRTLDVGPWPVAGEDAGVASDAGTLDAGMERGGGGCSATSSAPPVTMATLGFLLLAWRRRR